MFGLCKFFFRGSLRDFALGVDSILYVDVLCPQASVRGMTLSRESRKNRNPTRDRMSGSWRWAWATINS